MAESNYVNGVLRELWDDVSRIYTKWDAAGKQVVSRVYTPTENANADALAALSKAQENRAMLSAAALTAQATNRTFLALPTPTNPQVVAQVQALARQSNGVIRLVLGQLDATD